MLAPDQGRMVEQVNFTYTSLFISFMKSFRKTNKNDWRSKEKTNRCYKRQTDLTSKEN